MSENPQDIHAEVATLKAEVSNIANAVDNLAKAVARMGERDRDANKTNWAVVFGGVGLILAIMTPILTGFAWMTLRVDSQMTAHSNESGHAGAMIQHGRHAERFDRAFHEIDGNGVALKELDNNLQREMRDLTTALSTQIKATDDRLKTEMLLVGVGRETRLVQVEQRLNEGESGHALHTERVAALTEKVRALERKTFGVATATNRRK